MHTAKRARADLAIVTSSPSGTAFASTPSDPVGLVPMKLGSPDSSVRQADRSDPLHFAPATRPIHLAKARQFPNRATSRDGLETRDLADDLEARDRHRWLFSITSRRTLTMGRSAAGAARGTRHGPRPDQAPPRP